MSYPTLEQYEGSYDPLEADDVQELFTDLRKAEAQRTGTRW